MTTAAVGASQVGPNSASLRADTAADRGERTLAVMVAVARVGALVALAVDLVPSHWDGRRLVTVTALGVLAAVDSVVVIVTSLATGRLIRGLVALDMVCIIAVVGLTAVPAVFPGTPNESPFYKFAVVASITFGLADWQIWWTLLGAGALAAANDAAALEENSRYPLWNAVPDSLTFVAAAVVAWTLAKLLRNSARSVDRYNRLAVERAAELAMERERARQQMDLRSNLMSTVDQLASGDAITDVLIRAQLRSEADWLRRVVTVGLPDPSASVLAALRDVAAEKVAAGLQVDLDLAEEDLALPVACAGALVDAAREALTNVAKHAGTRRATLRALPSDGGLTVEIVDSGRGYNPLATTGGMGQRRSIRGRMEDVGGRAEIEASAGAGTRVRLWAPAEARTPA